MSSPATYSINQGTIIKVISSSKKFAIKNISRTSTIYGTKRTKGGAAPSASDIMLDGFLLFPNI